jgi:HAD superfamily hydrolase (TIGR01549 family)
MAPVRALVFDFGGTLDCAGRHWFDRFAQHYAACGLVLDGEQLRAAYDDATQRGYRAGAAIHNLGLESLLEFLVSLQFEHLERKGALVSRPTNAKPQTELKSRDLVRRIAAAFAQQSRDGMRRSGAQLAPLARRFRLGLASNFYGNLEVILAENNLLHFFEVVADSSRIGIFKPDAGIFTYVARRLRLKPNEIAMIGDSLDNDCRPARQLGMKTVWMVEEGRSPVHSLSDGADYVVNNIAQLAQLTW